MNELTGQVRAALAAHGAPPESRTRDRMGLFSVPFRPPAGPLSGKLLKPYRSGRDLDVLEPLVRRHATYLDVLGRTGLQIPETELILINEHAVLRPVIVQQAVPQSALLGWHLTRGETAAALRALDAAALSVCGFWAGVAQRPERIGMNASVRNFAVDASESVIFLDTFPPLIGFSREEMGRLLLRFSESGLMRGIGTILPGRVREIQDPWYSLPGNLGLLIEGAMRLRPKDYAAIRGWAEDFAGTNLSAPHRDALLKVLARPRPRVVRDHPGRRFGIGLRPHA